MSESMTVIYSVRNMPMTSQKYINNFDTVDHDWVLSVTVPNFVLSIIRKTYMTEFSSRCLIM
jgi:hypothetical protein